MTNHDRREQYLTGDQPFHAIAPFTVTVVPNALTAGPRAENPDRQAGTRADNDRGAYLDGRAASLVQLSRIGKKIGTPGTWTMTLSGLGTLVVGGRFWILQIALRLDLGRSLPNLIRLVPLLIGHIVWIR